jgi:hypothetical protein
VIYSNSYPITIKSDCLTIEDDGGVPPVYGVTRKTPEDETFREDTMRYELEFVLVRIERISFENSPVFYRVSTKFAIHN